MLAAVLLVVAAPSPPAIADCVPEDAVTEIRPYHYRVHVDRLGPHRPFDDPQHSNGMLVPRVKGGKVNGIKVSGVRRCSVLDRLGVKNGDVVLSVNGVEVTTPQQAFDLYDKLAVASRVVVQMARDATTLTVTYDIVPAAQSVGPKH